MNMIVSILVAVFFGLSQSLCLSPVAGSGQNTTAQLADGHGKHETPPCEQESDHCDMQSVAAAKGERMGTLAGLVESGVKAPVMLANPAWAVIHLRAPLCRIVPDRRSWPQSLSPLHLKVRFLN
ncbi:MAG: hypothetical protein JJ954_10460 [Hyphomonas sp.]|jgi:hypothetical protein|nr:hypothetical protein [Hyphomonas sp.]MAN90249.1 hypothetical protein [Hyphomonadaceae bacterium]MBO6583367.1 hypothetical protein [Hyphomonas sp.]QSR22347.1 hypothetical protein CFA77_08570 [Hyphomonas sp. KY3]|tara:strand:- start:267 stop:638 length:372 start_codon:yes stop_codon:yes gene_type:complete